ncbi:hypothetical protein GCM10007111_34480 [Virgibacillus kapii]|uniref:Uncharacterized protein n=1 Tax=Virgibacillus kapii TaxID=1638645 RepID=A0ABQ2DRX4_9BACI|nr:hypothetical protein GCM10007111_34480 [Virgibacillus kapii]
MIVVAKAELPKSYSTQLLVIFLIKSPPVYLKNIKLRYNQELLYKKFKNRCTDLS